MTGFKTAAELGLDDNEYAALSETLGMLERGEIPDNMFDIKTTGKPECGTPGCILGWAQTVGFGDRVWGAGGSPQGGLRRLFMPPSCGSIDRTPQQAAVALRSFLETAEPCWD